MTIGPVRPEMRSAFVTLLVAAVALSDAACSPARTARVGTGFVSHALCTGVFVSRLSPDRVHADTVQPILGRLDWMFRRHVDPARREVRTTLVGAFASRAIHREGLGCLVVHTPEPADSTIVPGRLDPVASLVPEIAGPEVVEPTDPRLRAALDGAFVEPPEPPHRRTKAVVVIHDGRVVAEHYAPGYGVDTPLFGYSDTKSVISALIGILVRDGRLAVDRPAPVPAWQEPNDPRRAITIDHLLRMTSGLAWTEPLSGAAPDQDSDRMTYLERDMARFAENRPLAAPPGTVWQYSSGNTTILSRIIRDAVGGGPSEVLRFAHRELFGPLGMRNVTLEFDATGTPVGGRAMSAPARDWARFGMLYLNDGVVGGRRLLPQGWVRYSSTPTPGAGIGYGAGFWTNLGGSPGAERRRAWGMPADSFHASGWLGQFVVVVPGRQLVVTRFGASHGPRGDVDGVSRLVGEVVDAIQARQR